MTDGNPGTKTSSRAAASGFPLNSTTLYQVLDSLEEVVWLIEAETRTVVWLNQTAEHTYGRSLHELQSGTDGWLDTVHPDDRAAVERGFDELSTLNGKPLLFRIQRPDGDVRWLRQNLQLLADDNRTLICSRALDVTDEQLTLARLEESEAVFHSLVESLPLNVLRKDLEGHLVFSNQRYCRTINRSLDEILGKTDFDLFPEELAAKYRADDLKVIRTRENCRDIEQHRTPDGQALYVEVFKGPVLNNNGDVVGIQCMFWNVTDRVQAEAALHRERDLLRTLMDNVPDLIFIKDRQGRFLTVNEALLRAMRRKSLNDVIGRTDADFWPSPLAKRYMEDDERVMASGAALVDREERSTDAEGRDIWLLTTKVPLYNSNGDVSGLVGIGRNITVRKRAEQETERQALEAKLLYHATTLAGQTSSFRQALQGCIDLVCELNDWPIGHVYLPDDDGHTLNPTDIWHRTDDHRFSLFQQVTEEARVTRGVDLPGRVWQERIPQWIPDAKSDLNFPRAELCDDIGIRGAFGFPILIEDDVVAVLEFFSWEEMDIDDQLVRIFRSVGEQIGRVVKRRRAREQLQRAKEAADAANQAKSDFLANMSHEIRTPMNAVIGISELMMNTPMGGTQRDYAKMIHESGESLLAIINDILDFSKIEAGKLDIEEVSFSLRECVGDTMKSLGMKAHEKQIELLWQAADDVPDQLVGDPGRLRQILLNLVGNGLKFTEQGEIAVDVRPVSQNAETIMLRFSVRDTGIGIPEDRLARIFDAFEQADTSTTRRFGGTGLGLAICSRIVKLMQGTISVDSEPGKGSTFHFTCPFRHTGESHGLLPGPQWTELQKLPVLIVDDNANNRRILEDLLTARGLRPLVAADAAEAIQILDESRQNGAHIPLVLSDVNMPDTDGFELAEKIRAHSDSSETVIIMLTSDKQESDRKQRKHLDIAGHLLKPVKQSELFDAILSAFEIGDDDSEGNPAAENEGPLLPPLKILLAEDAHVNQVVAIGLLEKRWNHQLTIVQNGREAVTRASNEPFDLVLMDVQMPELDGLEATAELRDIEAAGRLPVGSPSHLPIIALTAHAIKGDRERCLAAGMDGYVSKPIRPDRLLAAIRPLVTPGETIAFTTTDIPAKSTVQQYNSREFVDWHAALESVLGDPKLLRDVVIAFLGECPEHLNDLHVALQDRNRKTACRLAHLIKGVMGTLGVPSVQAVAKQLEDHCAEGDFAAAHSVYGDLAADLDTVTDLLTDFVEGRFTPSV